jgi:REP element-mobilizing transposase RayT
MTFRRKNIRLDRNAYEIPSQIFSITVCTSNRRRIFENDHHAKPVVSALKTGVFGNNTERFAYCLMPDHLHLLVAPRNGNLADLINGWKRFTGNRFRKEGLDGPFWQRGFYDHAVRREEDIQKAAD